VIFEDDKIDSTDRQPKVVMTIFSMLAEQVSAKKAITFVVLIAPGHRTLLIARSHLLGSINESVQKTTARDHR
jgi:hypothetical protein